MRSAPVWTALRRLLAGAAATALLACDAAGASTGCPAIPDWPGPASLAVPANLVTLDDRAWTTLTDASWNYLRRSSSRDDDICVDRLATPPRRALRIVFTPDMAPNTEPSVHWTSLPRVTAVYAAWTVRLSRNWVSGPAGGGKMTFLFTGHSGQVYTNLYHPCAYPETCGPRAAGPPYKVGVNTEWAPYGQRVWYPNVATTWVNPGDWHRIEVYFRRETVPGKSGDGVIRWWVDGVLNGNYTDVHYPADRFIEFQFAPTLQTPPPAEQYMYVSHTYLAAARGETGGP